MQVGDVTLTMEDDESLLQALVSSDAYRDPFVLWYRFPGTAHEFISSDSGNAWVAALLLPAMKVGEVLEIPVPISRLLFQTIEQIQAVYLAWDPTLSRIEVKAPLRNDSPSPGSEVGLFFSSGVDSWYSLLKNDIDRSLGEDPITQLIVVHGADIDVGNRKKDVFAKMLANTQMIGEQTGRSVLWNGTNIRNLYTKLGISWHWGQGGALASVGLAVESMTRKFHIASWFSYADELPGGCHPVLDPLWSTESSQFVHDGCEFTRQEKLRLVTQSELAMQTLRVCWANESARFNCGNCAKCLRTMLALHALGALGRCRTLPSTIHADAFREASFIFAHEFGYFQEVLSELDESPQNTELRNAVAEGVARGQASFDRIHSALKSIDVLIPLADSFILVDDEVIRFGLSLGRHAIPFLERDGMYDGPPADDATAIREFERLRGAGAKFMAFWRDAFWWLGYYEGLNRYLRSTFSCVLENDSLIVFDLRSKFEPSRN